MSNILLANTPFVTVGLGTFTYTVPTTGVYSISGQTTVPEALPTGDGAGSGKGLGSGAGGGDAIGFSQGGSGLGHGGVGQGFGPVPNNYNQPSAQPSNATQGPAVSSSLVIAIKQNGTTKYTSPTLSLTQSAMQFRQDFYFTAADAIEIDLTSSGAPDNQLNTVKTTLNLITGP